MLTQLTVRKFKRFDEITVELGDAVVLIGPNNSGKTSALQALTLWETGLRKWNEKRKDKSSAKQRIGVTINRKDLVSTPAPSAKLFWKELHVREGITKGTKNVMIETLVEGITNGKYWSCGLEFDYANEESFYCRPARLSDGERMEVPEEASRVAIAYLPPMSGLAEQEFKKEKGEVAYLIGQGQTAQVLRNLCYAIHDAEDESLKDKWQKLVEDIRNLFGVTLLDPEFIAERSEIIMEYKEPTGTKLDLSCSGRGLQQILLLLAHVYGNPDTVWLLDEPDAHLEVLRQRQTYRLLTQAARENNCQIVAASHSEIVLNEAVGRDVVVAFLGQPHRIDNRSHQVKKALTEIGYDQYLQAEQKGWIIYLEGSTDLDILKAFAKKLGHQAIKCLEDPFVHYVGNKPAAAQNHFYGLLEAKPDLSGIAIYDNIAPGKLQSGPQLKEFFWKRREIENYLCSREALLAYSKYDIDEDDLFGRAEAGKRQKVMDGCIRDLEAALKTARRGSPWAADFKVTDDFLGPLFENYFSELKLPNLLRKSNYHLLAEFIQKEQIEPEITEKLDAIVEAAENAKPVD